MKLARIFQDVEETLFLKKLSLHDRLFLVGEAAPLEYIKNFFSEHKDIDHNYYCVLSSESETIAKAGRDLESYQAIVVVSMQNEAAWFSMVKRQVAVIAPKLPVLRLFGDIFINLLCRRPLLQPTVDRTLKPDLSYAILSTPRSGSTYLCDLLDSTNLAGRPREHLRQAAQDLSLHCDFDYLRLLNNVMQYCTTDNGVFGTKIISHFLFEFQQTKFDFKQIFRSIDKFILLIRKDKLAQAVSLELAQRTEIWHLHTNKKDTSYQSKLADIEIDSVLLDDVERKYDFIHQQEARLKKILANHQVEPLEIFYEDLHEDAQLQVDRILEFLAIAKPESYVSQIKSGIIKMPSEISQEIMRQYRQRKSTVGQVK